MLNVALDDLEESHLLLLCECKTPESSRLEFKETLDLSGMVGKREVPKDVSSMANADGGRIVYGIKEDGADGSKFAGSIKPLVDGSVVEMFENIVVTTIQPRPRFRLRKIMVAGGFALVVEIYSSYGEELHMAVGYGEYRFHRRAEQRSVLMAEPEIREAYARIAVRTQALEDQLETAIAKEAKARSAAQESIIVVPWYARRNLADPRLLEGVGSKLASGPFRDRDFSGYISNIKVFAGGMRVFVGGGGNPAVANWYFSISKNGLVHFSQKDLISSDGPRRYFYRIEDTLVNILMTISSSSLMYDLCNYWGPVRVIHRLYVPEDCSVVGMSESMPAGHHQGVVHQINLREVGSDREPTLGELMDQLSQRMGQVRCEWFDESGHLLNQHKNKLAPRYSRNDG